MYQSSRFKTTSRLAEGFAPGAEYVICLVVTVIIGFAIYGYWKMKKHQNNRKE
tara:strand:- start:805 stop:963 length:159 start_codon:yes stop_codon:yes gene_type:complete